MEDVFPPTWCASLLNGEYDREKEIEKTKMSRKKLCVTLKLVFSKGFGQKCLKKQNLNVTDNMHYLGEINLQQKQKQRNVKS